MFSQLISKINFQELNNIQQEITVNVSKMNPTTFLNFVNEYLSEPVKPLSNETAFQYLIKCNTDLLNILKSNHELCRIYIKNYTLNEYDVSSLKMFIEDLPDEIKDFDDIYELL